MLTKLSGYSLETWNSENVWNVYFSFVVFFIEKDYGNLQKKLIFSKFYTKCAP